MYIRPYPGGRFRVEVEKHGQRPTHIADTRREAKAWGLKKEAELDALSGSGGKAFLTATTHYITTVSPHKRESALAWEQRRFSAMLDHFGEGTKLANITSEVIGKWRDKRLETVSGSTVNREANLLRHLFTLATDEWRWIDRNPFTGVRLPKENLARHQLWGWQDIRRVLRAGQRAGPKTKEVSEAFHISLRTGMRMKEALAAPSAFDARRRVVSVPSKTSRRPEEIPIGRVAAKLLVRSPFVVGANEASTLFSKLTKSIMIKDLTFHDARATALTHLARKVDVMVLARISRHKDINLLHRVYYRVTSDEIASKL